MLKFLLIAAVLFVLYKIVAAVTEKSKDRKFEKFKEEQAAVAEKNRAEKQAKIQRQLTSVKDFRTGKDVNLTAQLEAFLAEKKAGADYRRIVRMALDDGNYFAKYWLLARDNLRNSDDFRQAVSDAATYRDVLTGQDWADMAADILLLGDDPPYEINWQDRQEPQVFREIQKAVEEQAFSRIGPLLYADYCEAYSLSNADSELLLHILLPRISFYREAAAQIWGLSQKQYNAVTASYWANKHLGEPKYLYDADWQHRVRNSWRKNLFGCAPRYEHMESYEIANRLYQFRSNAAFRALEVYADPGGEGGFRLLRELLRSNPEADAMFLHNEAPANAWYHVLLDAWKNHGDSLSLIVLQEQLRLHNDYLKGVSQGEKKEAALRALGRASHLPNLSDSSGLFAFYLLGNPDLYLEKDGDPYANRMQSVCIRVAASGGIPQRLMDEYLRDAWSFQLRLRDNPGYSSAFPQRIYSLKGEVWDYDPHFHYYEVEGGKSQRHPYIYRMIFPAKTIDILEDGYVCVSGVLESPTLTDTNYDFSFRTYRSMEFRW